MYRFLHISIGPAFGIANRDAINARLGSLSHDWLNYNTHCWVVWTNKSPITLSEMMLDLINPQDQIVVFGINEADLPAGRMPQWVWDWLNRPRDRFSGAVRTPALPAPAAVNPFLPPTMLGSQKS